MLDLGQVLGPALGPALGQILDPAPGPALGQVLGPALIPALSLVLGPALGPALGLILRLFLWLVLESALDRVPEQDLVLVLVLVEEPAAVEPAAEREAAVAALGTRPAALHPEVGQCPGPLNLPRPLQHTVWGPGSQRP